MASQRIAARVVTSLELGVEFIATVGIYGVISYSVARRSKEFGLRMALGARPANILSLVLKQGVLLTGIGVVVGLVAALILTRLMASLLFGVTSTDAITYLGVSALLVAWPYSPRTYQPAAPPKSTRSRRSAMNSLRC